MDEAPKTSNLRSAVYSPPLPLPKHKPVLPSDLLQPRYGGHFLRAGHLAHHVHRSVNVAVQEPFLIVRPWVGNGRHVAVEPLRVALVPLGEHVAFLSLALLEEFHCRTLGIAFDVVDEVVQRDGDKERRSAENGHDPATVLCPGEEAMAEVEDHHHPHACQRFPAGPVDVRHQVPLGEGIVLQQGRDQLRVHAEVGQYERHQCEERPDGAHQ